MLRSMSTAVLNIALASFPSQEANFAISMPVSVFIFSFNSLTLAVALSKVCSGLDVFIRLEFGKGKVIFSFIPLEIIPRRSAVRVTAWGNSRGDLNTPREFLTGFIVSNQESGFPSPPAIAFGFAVARASEWREASKRNAIMKDFPVPFFCFSPMLQTFAVSYSAVKNVDLGI